MRNHALVLILGVIFAAAVAAQTTQAPPPLQTAGQGRGGGQGAAGGQQPARDAQAQQQAVGTGVISGTVLTEGTGAPVRRARVNLSATELRGARSAMTNDDSAFSFAALPAGRYQLSASKAGYVNIAYG